MPVSQLCQDICLWARLQKNSLTLSGLGKVYLGGVFLIYTISRLTVISHTAVPAQLSAWCSAQKSGVGKARTSYDSNSSNWTQTGLLQEWSLALGHCIPLPFQCSSAHAVLDPFFCWPWPLSCTEYKEILGYCWCRCLNELSHSMPVWIHSSEWQRWKKKKALACGF